MTKKSRQKFKHPKNEKSFNGEIKSIFHHFKGLSVAKNCLRAEDAPLKYSVSKEIPRFFHKGSNYDYHFIIKELAEEFERQLT